MLLSYVAVAFCGDAARRRDRIGARAEPRGSALPLTPGALLDPPVPASVGSAEGDWPGAPEPREGPSPKARKGGHCAAVGSTGPTPPVDRLGRRVAPEADPTIAPSGSEAPPLGEG